MTFRTLRDRLMEQVKVSSAQRGIFLVPHRDSEWKEQIELVLQIKRERNFLLNPGEACQILSAVKATRHVPGDLAEFGVANGASAKLIATAAGGRTVHLFDTFEGLPAPGEHDDTKKFPAGLFRGNLESVQAYLTGLPVNFHKGLFPATAEAVRDHRFSFVHLDADLYQSTLDGLTFFYPRLSAGGIVISHDFGTASGVAKAFAEFFAAKPEPVIPLAAGYQVMVVKLA